jgi:hypothetical protein
VDYDQKSPGNVHLREEIFHFCKKESAVLSGKPTIIDAIRHPDLFDSLFKTQSSWVGWRWIKARNRQNSSW